MNAVKLEVQERLALLGLLSADEEHYEALKTLRRAKEMLAFTPEEIEALDFKQNVVDGKMQFTWNTDVGPSMLRDIPVDEWTTQRIRRLLSAEEAEGKLKDRHVTLYEKFVIDYL